MCSVKRVPFPQQLQDRLQVQSEPPGLDHSCTEVLYLCNILSLYWGQLPKTSKSPFVGGLLMAPLSSGALLPVVHPLKPHWLLVQGGPSGTAASLEPLIFPPLAPALPNTPPIICKYVKNKLGGDFSAASPPACEPCQQRPPALTVSPGMQQVPSTYV